MNIFFIFPNAIIKKKYYFYKFDDKITREIIIINDMIKKVCPLV
jgi:hypothetical protein